MDVFQIMKKKQPRVKELTMDELKKAFIKSRNTDIKEYRGLSIYLVPVTDRVDGTLGLSLKKFGTRYIYVKSLLVNSM